MILVYIFTITAVFTIILISALIVDDSDKIPSVIVIATLALMLGGALIITSEAFDKTYKLLEKYKKKYPNEKFECKCCE